MALQVLDDPEARKNSLMLKQKCLCNGEATGYQCEYYWRMTRKLDVPNPDQFALGETLRHCMVDVSEATFLGDGGEDMAVNCTSFKQPSLLKRILGQAKKYDARFEEYNPLPPVQATKTTPEDNGVLTKDEDNEDDAQNTIAAIRRDLERSA